VTRCNRTHSSKWNFHRTQSSKWTFHRTQSLLKLKTTENLKCLVKRLKLVTIMNNLIKSTVYGLVVYPLIYFFVYTCPAFVSFIIVANHIDEVLPKDPCPFKKGPEEPSSEKNNEANCKGCCSECVPECTKRCGLSSCIPEH